jgi:lysyl-tRNA synthetase class II
MGKSMFIDIRDQSGRIQAYAQKNVLGDEQFHIFQHLDLGDFIGVNGTMFTTKTGEISVKLISFVILAKALRPPPAKYYGLEDTEIRYRQRYLDLIANPDVKDVMLKRSAIIHEIRAFFHGRGYVEVETPAMQAIPGGAAAQPFKTFHNALGCEFYLRIALELYHKRLLVGGIDKLFEIGKNFRNEGLSRRHNPEFTMLEAYQAFGDYNTMMETVESLITTVAQKVVGTLAIKHDQTGLTKITIQNAIHALENAQTEMLQAKAVASENKSILYKQVVEIFGTTISKLRDCLSLDAKTSEGIAIAACQEVLQGLTKTSPTKNQALQMNVYEWYGELSSVMKSMSKFVFELSNLGQEKVINLSTPWRRVKYNDLVCERIRPDWFTITHAERLAYAEQVLDVEVAGRPLRKLQEAARRHQPFWDKMNVYFQKSVSAVHIYELPEADQSTIREAVREITRLVEYKEKGVADFEITQAVFEKLIEPTLINPTFVTHLPKELVPLAKLSPDDPTTVEVFECCINGQEISPGYTEQNDPIAQRATLEHQAGGEQQKLDEDFLVALEHGMPPAGGIGIGIDRLCMMLLGQESIRDVILFPQLKPK